MYSMVTAINNAVTYLKVAKRVALKKVLITGKKVTVTMCDVDVN